MNTMSPMSSTDMMGTMPASMNMMMMPRCTMTMEKMADGMKMMCVSDDDTAAAMIARSPESITLAEILKALDGPLVPFRCVAIRSDKTCEECVSAQTCPIRVSMTHISTQLQSLFADVSLSVLAQDAYRLESIVRPPVVSQRSAVRYEKFESLDNL